MYDHIQGEVIEKQPARAVLRTAGVGYEIKVPMTTAATLKQGATATLYTILHVVDGTPTLLGFASRPERELARRILGVTGVGPAIALSILSVHTPAEFVAIVLGGEASTLRRVKGVGQKTAERLCLELRDVLPKLDLDRPVSASTVLVPVSSRDATAALVTLGYSEKEARDKVDKARSKKPEASTEELVKSVLQM